MPTGDQLANVPTKGLSSVIFHNLTIKLGVEYIHSQTLGAVLGIIVIRVDSLILEIRHILLY